MIVTKKDSIETWTAKSFLRYVLEKLEDKGFTYRPTYPHDMMYIGVMFRSCKLAGKTNSFIRQRLDDKLDNCTLQRVKSLQFILSFFPDITMRMRRTTYVKTPTPAIPDRAIRALRELKKSILK